MRINGAKKVHYDSGPNMTPLVDVVMVILIFLMLVGSFGGLEHYLSSNLPLKKEGGGRADKTKNVFDDTMVDIRVDHDPANPNAWRAKFGDIVTGSPDRLKDALESKFKTYAANGTGPDKLQVIINPNRFVKWKGLIAVYEAALRAGYTKIAFSTSH